MKRQIGSEMTRKLENSNELRGLFGTANFWAAGFGFTASFPEEHEASCWEQTFKLFCPSVPSPKCGDEQRNQIRCYRPGSQNTHTETK